MAEEVNQSQGQNSHPDAAGKQSDGGQPPVQSSHYDEEAIKQAKAQAPDPSSILMDDKSFFQDPFIDPNSTSFQQKKDEILKMTVPPHDLQINEKEFVELVATSISLTHEEKKQIILSVPRLTQFQVDELIKILKDEQKKFKELNEKHMKKLKDLEEKQTAKQESLEQKTERLMREKQDQKEAEDILKNIENL